MRESNIDPDETMVVNVKKYFDVCDMIEEQANEILRLQAKLGMINGIGKDDEDE